MILVEVVAGILNDVAGQRRRTVGGFQGVELNIVALDSIGGLHAPSQVQIGRQHVAGHV